MSQSLLLLPQHPAPATAATLGAAYYSSISAVLSSLKTSSSSTKLTIALASSNFHGRLKAPRSQIYNEAEKLLAGVYSLICSICAKEGVNITSKLPGAVDFHIVLLDYDSTRFLNQTNSGRDVSLEVLAGGPIVELPLFASTRRHWNKIFSVEGEGGQNLLGDFLQFASRISPPLHAELQMVGGGVSMVKTISQSIQPNPSTSHTVVAVGGDELLKNKKYSEYLQSWEERQNDVAEFLTSILSFAQTSGEEAIQTVPVENSTGRAIHTKLNACSITIECVEIQDPYGPTITDETVTALVVSGETRSGGQAVNDKRVEKGWKALEVYEVDVLDAQAGLETTSTSDEFASKISSTAIRKQMADRTPTSSL
ncbi:hypothetical protein SS1G_04571 [Sclerotinia sclerotiorum 1980 UF-70]|uniref:Uncharacterized protein n=1 Tax=Sclerotinia sclerotiorum (strain ATCC 18683 / 1980 / Ss-1) TaxID=665079 RepID=A7EGX9_SCLS1|nr:hypothetical protein SS1G_04571 [Sclerotinia sclerotiorum 1980 UF-70]EDO02095.1 hypothetical protein SS1G_04571 [Sclerotinia sclerotiorum 1980 UF-70]